jgi:hypothetical protein
MIAAIYARKSTEQFGVADEQKSVARQVDHARAYAQRKGWAVADDHIYVDDGVSGAEFSTRPGLIRVLNVLRRIFKMCADGIGFTTIAKALNAEGAPCPRSQQGRPKGWAPSSIREVLYRPIYRGEMV